MAGAIIVQARESMARVAESRGLPPAGRVRCFAAEWEIEEIAGCGNVRIDGLGRFVTRELAEGLLEFLGRGELTTENTEEEQ